jgi:hypothetical protein
MLVSITQLLGGHHKLHRPGLLMVLLLLLMVLGS